MWATNVCSVKPEVLYKTPIFLWTLPYLLTTCDLSCAWMKHQIMTISQWIKRLTYFPKPFGKETIVILKEAASYPGMPMAPSAWERETSWGQSSKSLMSSLPSDTVCVLQPPRPTTWQPTGNEGLLLWITLQSKYRTEETLIYKVFDQMK